jgi:hypothetical protein
MISIVHELHPMNTGGLEIQIPVIQALRRHLSLTLVDGEND